MGSAAERAARVIFESLIDAIFMKTVFTVKSLDIGEVLLANAAQLFFVARFVDAAPMASWKPCRLHLTQLNSCDSLVHETKITCLSRVNHGVLPPW
jgi:hypothetical protein